MKIWADGRVTIPKDTREKYGFLPGTEVDVTLENGLVHIRPAKDKRPLKRRRKASVK